MFDQWVRASVVCATVLIGACGTSPTESATKADPGTPPPCATGAGCEGASDGVRCQTDADCTSDYCAQATCTPPPAGVHGDGRRNGGETDVDCGGPSGVICAPGLACKVASDCATTCEQGLCAAPNAADGVKNNGETDVDCGGPNAKKCGLTKVCAADADCGLAYCNAGSCAAPAANDALKNGTETDVDCGGAAQSYDGVDVPAAPACVVAKTCGVDTDCTTSVCAENKRCVESPSCRQVHGGYTCGTGEFGQFGAAHESCCKSLPVPGLTMTKDGASKQVYLDKYEITAGRVRQWLTAIKSQFGGVPNVQAWVKTRMATDPILASAFPSTFADDLPAQASGQLRSFPYHAGGTITLDMGLDAQVGPTSYYRGTQPGLGQATSGCSMDAGGYGHRTYWSDKPTSDAFNEVYRPNMQEILDEKSMNCITPIMFAAFCAWDGGYMPTQAAIIGAYGTKKWPWGDLPEMNDNVALMGNYNLNTNFGARAPRYLSPLVNYNAFANDFSSIIAAPGRFPKDMASEVRPNQETWMDLGGNMIEWNINAGAYFGWTGSSFEGHLYPRLWTSAVYYLDKYGKGGVRCMRLQ